MLFLLLLACQTDKDELTDTSAPSTEDTETEPTDSSGHDTDEPSTDTTQKEDADGDGYVELGFQLRHHNGTASDGGFIRWLRITDDLDLEEVHVSRLYDWVSVESRREEGFIRYRLLRDPDGTLRDEAWFENPAFGLGPVRVLDHSPGVPRGGEWFSYR